MNHSLSLSRPCHVVEFGAGTIADNSTSSGTTLPAGTW
ncbi:hypothetical protein QFZ49_004580 [Streptomyces turgidiscabies]|uniref:Uncharacterized protein n=1 Tax=Streptomyces turgidiscabies TaxID=85558 RepID=A0ABU0RRN0_9ACTN|nr:hypothetical protein [Streptomyces turgidiscabies]